MALANKKEPDFSNINIYVNAVENNILYTDTRSLNECKYSAIRIKMSTVGNSRVIVFKDKKTFSYGGVDYSANCFYLLGNDAVVDCQTLMSSSYIYPQGRLWVRGANVTQLDGSQSDFGNVTNLDNTTFFQNTDAKTFSFGSGGTNGGYLTYKDDVSFGLSGLYPCKQPTSQFTAKTTADNSNFWVGIDNSMFPTSDSTHAKFKSLSGEKVQTYYSTPYTLYTMRTYPWVWSNGGSDTIASWSDMQNAYYTDFLRGSNHASPSDVFDGSPLFTNVYITENYDDAIAYITDGTVPPDAEITESDETGKPKPSSGDVNDDNDDDSTDEEEGNPNDNKENTPNNAVTPSCSPTIGKINQYILTKAQCATLVQWFWNESIVTDWTDLIANTISGMYGNLTQCITGIKKMPVIQSLYCGTSASQPSVHIGRYQLDTIQPVIIASIPTNNTIVGIFRIPKKYNNFVDYAPYTNVSIYLPFVGIIPLDTNVVMGRWLKIECTASAYTGEIQYELYITEENGGITNDETLIGIYTAMCGIDVPYSLDNALSMFNNTMQTIGNVGNMLGVNSGVTDLLSGGTSSPMVTSMSASNQLGLYLPKKCALIIKRKRYNLPSNYASKVGYLCKKKLTLSQCKGFTVIDEPQIKTWLHTSPLPQEIEEIYNLMKGGIVL